MSRWSIEGLEAQLDGFRLGPVDLALDPGRSLVVLGNSGAGKTSLLRAIAGFLPVRKGRILRDGIDVTSVPPEHRRLGYVPQGLGLLPHRTVEQNVRYPMELRGRSDAARRSRDLLERFRLTALAARHPARLSGGEQQRVAIARALAADPELILWDEPWQALDVVARHELGAVWEELRAQDSVPVVVVTHDPALAFSIGDLFAVLRSGRVARQGDARSLLERPTDAFTARFIGLENVFEPRAIEAGPPGPFHAWLRERTGPGGLAFGAPTWGGPGRIAAPCTGRVIQCRPGPGGLSIEVESESCHVYLRGPSAASPAPPRLGSTVLFDLEGVRWFPLREGGPETAGGAA